MAKIIKTQPTGRVLSHKSGWQDSNLRPPGPKPGAITGLRYIPKNKKFTLLQFCGESGIRTHGTV
jgi:hypothetical protein